jgi:hypothetical protein
MFRLMRGIYQQNDELQQTGGFFLTWAGENYVAASAMAFRRELDTQSGTENLLHLLREMRARPSVISRARFRSGWTGNLKLYTADHGFEVFPIIRDGSTPEADHIDPASIDADLDKLQSVDAVLEHVQTTVAHRVPERPNALVPTFDEFHKAIDVVHEVFGRYYMLLTHKALISFEPAIQYDEFAPFRFAWISDPEHFDSTRCE